MESFANDGLTFDVRDGGPRHADDAVVLLHGFPESPASWDAVAPRLHDAGVRTLAPTLRGYTPGARPRSRSAYRIERLVGDVVALLDAAGVDRGHVVGHDWGGGIAWAVATAVPDRVASLTVLSTPHPDSLPRALVRSNQALRSWYMLAMQIPVLPELLLSRAVRRRGLGSIGLPEDVARGYAEALSDRESVRGMIGPYRGLFVPAPRGAARLPSGPVRVPTTYVWGNRDPFLGRTAAEETARFCAADYRFVELDAGHWLPERHAEAVSDEILARITQS